MPRIVFMIEVDDLPEWERRFRTHGDLFRRQTIDGLYEYTMIEDGNRVVLSAEVHDIDTFFEVLETPDANAAKDFDGVDRPSIQVFVLDKRFEF